MSARSLATVRRAATRKRDAQATYRQAVVEARADGHTLAAIASAAGVTRQNIFKLLRRIPEGGNDR